jgi:hypothetical protein
MSLSDLGELAARLGKTSEACSYIEEASARFEEMGDPQSVACLQALQGYVLVLEGRLGAGWMEMLHALRFSVSGARPAQTADAICHIGKASVHAGHWQLGAELLGLSFRLMPRMFSDQHELSSEPELGMLRAALGAEGLEAAMARGAALDLDQIVAEILACETPEAYWGVGPEGIVTES